jgi:GDPmannose 4,6-dehydratase
VIATGEAHSVARVPGGGVLPRRRDWQQYVKISSGYYRPTEVDPFVDDASKAPKRFGWSPSVGFKDLVALMMDADVRALDQRRDANG